MRASSVGTCRHCRRPVLRAGSVWLHTDLQAACLCPWRVALLGTLAEPADSPPPALVPPPRRQHTAPPVPVRLACDPDCWCRGKTIAGAA